LGMSRLKIGLGERRSPNRPRGDPPGTRIAHPCGCPEAGGEKRKSLLLGMSRLKIGLGERRSPNRLRGDPPGTRTLNPLIKSQLLCQIELVGRNSLPIIPNKQQGVNKNSQKRTPAEGKRLSWGRWRGPHQGRVAAWNGFSPFSNRARSVTTISDPLVMTSRVAPPMWGVARTLGSDSSGSPGEGGSS
jgi:hypothetical protein